MTSKLGTLQRHLRGAFRRSIGIVLSILAGVFVGSLVMIWYKQNPVEIYTLLLKGAVGSQRSIFIAMQRATPLIFTRASSSSAPSVAPL